MAPSLTRCFHCGGTTLEERQVEELLSVGKDVVRCKAMATVCLQCGERYFDPETIHRFEGIRARLRAGDLTGLRSSGQVLETAA